jgi:hypothetical protein
MRSRLRSGGAAVGFFAFQDIITAVIGIVIFIALLLSFFIGTESDIIRKKRIAELATPEQLAELEKLRAIIATLQKEYAEATSLTQVDPDTRIANLLREIEMIEAQTANIEQTTPSPSATELEVQENLKAIRIAVQNLETKRDELASTSSKMLAKVENLEQEIRETERLILEEQKNNNDILVVHDDAITTKRPVLITISDTEMSVQTLDSAGKPPITGKDIRSLLKPFDPLEHYTVFYIKPSAFPIWAEIMETVDELSFDLGYEPIRENQTINLQPTGS